MLFNIGTVGFSKLDNQDKRYKVINDVINNSTKAQSFVTDESACFIENKKQYGKEIGVIVRGVQEENKVTVTNIVPYADAGKTIKIKELYVQRMNMDFLPEKQVIENEYQVTCVTKRTDMEMTFYLQNVVEYLKNIKSNNKLFESVSISALAYEGKILLPLADNEESIYYEESIYNNGDDEEEEDDIEEMGDAANFLDYMETFFFPTPKNETVYHMLGEIKNIKRISNTETKEIIYKLEVKTMDMNIYVYVNKKDLVGMPIVGMRFLGTCWLQGSIGFGK